MNTTFSLEQISFSVEPSQGFALRGANGSGKSTLLRCIVGELAVERGTVSICGHNLTYQPVKAKAQIGYAADEPQLYADLSGQEHLQLWAALRKQNETTLAYAESLAERLGFGAALSELTRDYSRGTRQKLALVGALFHQPALVVLDEPLTATDSLSTTQAINLLKEVKENGGAILFATHNDMLEQMLADKVAVLANSTLNPEQDFGRKKRDHSKVRTRTNKS